MVENEPARHAATRGRDDGGHRRDHGTARQAPVRRRRKGVQGARVGPGRGMLPIGRRHVHLPGIIRRHLRRPTRPLHGMEEPGRARQTRERMGRPRTPGPARGRPDRRGRWRRMLLHRRAAHRLHAGHGLQPTAAGRRQRAGRYGPAGVRVQRFLQPRAPPRYQIHRHRVSRRQKGAGGLGSRFRPSCADHGQTRNVRREPA